MRRRKATWRPPHGWFSIPIRDYELIRALKELEAQGFSIPIRDYELSVRNCMFLCARFSIPIRDYEIIFILTDIFVHLVFYPYKGL